MKPYYRVHQVTVHLTRIVDQKEVDQLEQILNTLEGDLIAVIPSVQEVSWGHEQIETLLIIERLP